jgi:ATP-dependent protease ClpP protease subunit
MTPRQAELGMAINHAMQNHNASPEEAVNAVAAALGVFLAAAVSTQGAPLNIIRQVLDRARDVALETLENEGKS